MLETKNITFLLIASSSLFLASTGIDLEIQETENKEKAVLLNKMERHMANAGEFTQNVNHLESITEWELAIDTYNILNEKYGPLARYVHNYFIESTKGIGDNYLGLHEPHIAKTYYDKALGEISRRNLDSPIGKQYYLDLLVGQGNVQFAIHNVNDAQKFYADVLKDDHTHVNALIGEGQSILILGIQNNNESNYRLEAFAKFTSAITYSGCNNNIYDRIISIYTIEDSINLENIKKLLNEKIEECNKQEYVPRLPLDNKDDAIEGDVEGIDLFTIFQIVTGFVSLLSFIFVITSYLRSRKKKENLNGDGSRSATGSSN